MRSNKRKGGKPSHIVSVWSREDGFCLGHKTVEEKSNEITAIPELLDKIQVKGQIVTIDAMGPQKAIAEKIRRKRADYVLALKGNQNIIRKWSLSILKMIELMKPGLSMKKKRFVIRLRPIKYLEEVLSF